MQISVRITRMGTKWMKQGRPDELEVTRTEARYAETALESFSLCFVQSCSFLG